MLLLHQRGLAEGQPLAGPGQLHLALPDLLNGVDVGEHRGRGELVDRQQVTRVSSRQEHVERGGRALLVDGTDPPDQYVLGQGQLDGCVPLLGLGVDQANRGRVDESLGRPQLAPRLGEVGLQRVQGGDSGAPAHPRLVKAVVDGVRAGPPGARDQKEGEHGSRFLHRSLAPVEGSGPGIVPLRAKVEASGPRRRRGSLPAAPPCVETLERGWRLRDGGRRLAMTGPDWKHDGPLRRQE